ncbi:MAG TPA: LUD domain-containing protein [Thermomicrobiales bacterium]|nr:LUD domain-containing protein [Thermomicrobiales bacterium]
MDVPATETDPRILAFAEKATPLGTQVDHVRDVDGLLALIRSAAAEAGTQHVWIAPQLLGYAPDLAQHLTAAGLEPCPVTDRESARDQAIGLSLASRAIVETGSVLLDERTIEDRAPSIMTLHCLTIVPMDRVASTLDDVVTALRQMANHAAGGYGSFVTGPSRTADIEMSLTVGVQGPRQVSVIFVDHLTTTG